ncbi:MAG: S1C family serine protease [Tepidiformaceae bacterium]
MQPPADNPEERRQRATDGLNWSPASAPAEAAPGVAADSADPEASARQPRRSPGLAIVGAAAAVALVVGALAGAVAAVLVEGDESPPEASGPSEGPGGQFNVQQTSAIADTAAKGRQSVVRIESTRVATGGTVEDVGSGVVLDREGHILTNAHVVLGTESLKVVLPDGSERPAILIGHDFPFTDVAVLQVGPVGLAPIETGDSNSLVLGETVVAIGNPLAEFDGSVSVGVVSGLNRKRLFDAVRQDDLIQTDAAVNHGNSGGALLNLRGQFVGMPTAVLRITRNNQPVEGISFALPANRLLEVARRIIAEGGSYPRPSLGAEHIDITPEVTGRFPRLAANEGALLTAVTPAGPAGAAGSVAGDIVTSVAGAAVNRDQPLLNALTSVAPGQVVKVVLNRNGRIIEAEVRLGKRN